jgi:predicted ArsR family transcriptional regulator
VQSDDDLSRKIAGIAALDQPLRRDLYRLLARAEGWTTRDEAAAALAVARSVAVFHLDKLVEAGLVEVRFERTSGRTGPGAGRPSKLYRLVDAEVSASVPERHYDLAGSLLATAVAESTRTGAPVADCLRTAARAAGELLGEEANAAVAGARGRGPRRQAVLDVLARHGYEPEIMKRNEIALANCPFHRLAEEHRELVCGMNLDFLEGLLEGMGPVDTLSARLAPAPGFCCVRIDAT